jgi:uncharacterized pyridoxal phosphate-containing UPF0001 family protein
MSLAQNLAGIRERMATACERAGRSVDDVMLLPVSKDNPPKQFARRQNWV